MSISARRLKSMAWKTITLGTGLKTTQDFQSALTRIGCRKPDWNTINLLNEPAFTVSEVKREVNLVNLSVAELGFRMGATVRDIYSRAREIGLDLCPPEVGPQLRLQHREKHYDDCCHIAMKPISGTSQKPSLFLVGSDKRGCWFRASSGQSGLIWGGGERWVFVLPSDI